MLRKIYICKDREYEEYDWFCEQARQAGIEVMVIDKNALERRGDMVDTEDACEHRTDVINTTDALVITYTDDIREMFDNHSADKCIVGLGDRYSGSADYVIYNFDVTPGYIRLIYDRYNNQPHIVADTDKIIMREMTVADLPRMYEMYATLADCPYIEALYEYDREKEFTINYINNMYRFFQYGLWLVFDKYTGKLIGRVGLENREIDGITRQELGYLIRKDYQNRGYAYEACMCAIRYAREELGISELFACIHTDNIPSITLAYKLGFEIYAENIEGMNIYYKTLN